MKAVFLKLKMASKNLRDWAVIFFSRVFWKDKIVLMGLASALFFNLALLLLVYVKIPDSNLPLILHYSAYRGVDFLGESSRIYSLPAISLVFLMLNLILADFFYKKEKPVSYFFILSPPVIAVLLLLAAINLAIINS